MNIFAKRKKGKQFFFFSYNHKLTTSTRIMDALKMNPFKFDRLLSEIVGNGREGWGEQRGEALKQRVGISQGSESKQCWIKIRGSGLLI